MTDPSLQDDLFARIAGRVDVERHQGARVVIVGAGAVGSHVAEELARAGIGTIVLIDGDRLDPHNLVRHVLGWDDVGENKAEAMSRHLTRLLPSVKVEYVPRHVTNRFADATLDKTLTGAQLIIAATDNRRAQRRINRRALALDIPALFPGVEANAQRGEVFVTLGRGRAPCQECWDGFRAAEDQLREVSALKTDIGPTVNLTVHLALALLDPDSAYASVFAGDDAGRTRFGRPPTLFFTASPGIDSGMFADGRQLRTLFPEWRQNCPACGGEPSQRPPVPRRTGAVTTAPTTAGPRPVVFPLSGTVVFWLVALVLGVAGCSEIIEWSDEQQAKLEAERAEEEQAAQDQAEQPGQESGEAHAVNPARRPGRSEPDPRYTVIAAAQAPTSREVCALVTPTALRAAFGSQRLCRIKLARAWKPVEVQILSIATDGDRATIETTGSAGRQRWLLEQTPNSGWLVASVTADPKAEP